MATKTLPRRGARRHAAKPKPKKTRKRGFFRRYWWLWTPPLGAVVAVVPALSFVYTQLPLQLDLPQDQTSILFDVNGKELTRFEAGVDRQPIDLEDMPRHLIEAVLAAEDAGFYRHGGVSVTGIIRAAWANVTGGEITQGGSTITQQYVRNVYPQEVGTERTYTRKIKEVLLAMKLERALSKDEILERYLNTIYLGEGAYGMEAAAQTYFGKRARGLNVLQSATLAGLISGPELFDPRDNPDNSAVRRNYVLDRMAQLGFLEPERAGRLKQKGVHTVGARKGFERSPAAYYIDYTRRYMERKYGGDTFTGGFRIRGTLDAAWQEAAETAIANRLSLDPGTPAAALVAIDVDTGEVRAMVGGRDFRQAQVNLATGDGGTGRQSGSAFKPFTLAAAIKQGVSLRSVFSGPGKISIDDPRCGGWEPGNYSDSGAGTMDLVQATANSVNTIFAQLVVEVGPDAVAELARDMGIRSDLGDPAPCSITLGTKEVSPLEMTEAYASFASLGIHRRATPVRLIRGPDGDVIHRNGTRGQRILQQNEALQAIYTMKAVVSGGTGTAAGGLGFEVFGKTGTTDDDSDVWFCGASSEVAACVWVGHPDARTPMPGATGGSVAAPIWHEFMAAVHSGLDPQPFATPEFTGELISGSAPIPAPSPEPTEEPTEEPTKEPKKSPKPPPSPTPPSPPPPPSPSPTEEPPEEP
ncbi:MAG: transglycosylase domain-containing protein [Actinomycetota bacterium]